MWVFFNYILILIPRQHFYVYEQSFNYAEGGVGDAAFDASLLDWKVLLRHDSYHQKSTESSASVSLVTD